MPRIILVLALVAVHPLLSLSQTTQADMSVFGYKLGEKMTLPECKCQVVETTEGYGLATKHFKNYQYTFFSPPSGTGDCFERTDMFNYRVRKKDQLSPLPAVTNGMINIKFDPANTPKICALGSFGALLADSKLMAITFSIRTSDADEVFETLKKKYGPGVAVKSYQLQNGYGATLNYYIAVWSFPNLIVTMESSEHRSLTDAFGLVSIEIPKPGSAPVDKRPL